MKADHPQPANNGDSRRAHREGSKSKQARCGRAEELPAAAIPIAVMCALRALCHPSPSGQWVRPLFLPLHGAQSLAEARSATRSDRRRPSGRLSSCTLPGQKVGIGPAEAPRWKSGRHLVQRRVSAGVLPVGLRRGVQQHPRGSGRPPTPTQTSGASVAHPALRRGHGARRKRMRMTRTASRG